MVDDFLKATSDFERPSRLEMYAMMVVKRVDQRNGIRAEGVGSSTASHTSLCWPFVEGLSLQSLSGMATIYPSSSFLHPRQPLGTLPDIWTSPNAEADQPRRF